MKKKTRMITVEEKNSANYNNWAVKLKFGKIVVKLENSSRASKNRAQIIKFVYQKV